MESGMSLFSSSMKSITQPLLSGIASNTLFNCPSRPSHTPTNALDRPNSNRALFRFVSRTNCMNRLHTSLSQPSQPPSAVKRSSAFITSSDEFGFLLTVAIIRYTRLVVAPCFVATASTAFTQSPTLTLSDVMMLMNDAMSDSERGKRHSTDSNYASRLLRTLTSQRSSGNGEVHNRLHSLCATVDGKEGMAHNTSSASGLESQLNMSSLNWTSAVSANISANTPRIVSSSGSVDTSTTPHTPSPHERQ